jgi:hypothetical protein
MLRGRKVNKTGFPLMSGSLPSWAAFRRGSDNAKVGITHACYWDPVINASYAATSMGTAPYSTRQATKQEWPIYA